MWPIVVILGGSLVAATTKTVITVVGLHHRHGSTIITALSSLAEIAPALANSSHIWVPQGEAATTVPARIELALGPLRACAIVVGNPQQSTAITHRSSGLNTISGRGKSGGLRNAGRLNFRMYCKLGLTIDAQDRPVIHSFC